MTDATSYADAYGTWMRDPEAYWAAEAAGIAWDKPWDAVFDKSNEIDAQGQRVPLPPKPFIWNAKVG